MKKNQFVQLAEFTQPLKKNMSFKKMCSFKGSFFVLGRVNPSSFFTRATLSNPSSNGSYSSTISTFQVVQLKLVGHKKVGKMERCVFGSKIGNFVYIHYIFIYYTIKKQVDWIAAFCQIKTIQRQFVSPPPIKKA